RARVHPIAVLAALMSYRTGHGVRGSSTWQPVAAVVDALGAGFYASFGAVEASGKRTLLALDVSGSMSNGELAGAPGLPPRIASAALALITAATEQQHTFIAFTAAPSHGGKWGGGTSGLTQLSISPRQRLDDVVGGIDKLAMGGTDCALP